MNPAGRTPTAPIVRFGAKVDMSDPVACWQWRGHLTRDGYGRFWNGKREMPAQVWSFEHFVGPVPDGLELDHLCRNRACVNWRHLEPVTRRVNILRSNNMAARHARKTECANGHPFTEENVKPRGDGRRCHKCSAEQSRARKARLRADRIAAGTFGKPVATHCGNGHEYTAETTSTTARGRVCRICARARNAKYDARRRAA